MRLSTLDFPQARMAPEHVMRGLEDLDPTACIVHLGGTRWCVGKIRPNAEVRQIAENMFANWERNISIGRRLNERAKQRVRFAMLALLGFRPVHQYTLIGEPDGRIVEDFRRSRFQWLHTTESEFWHEIDTAQRDKAEASRKDVSDTDRAKDAWKYAFTRSHRMGTSLTPEEKPKSGYQRVMSIAS